MKKNSVKYAKMYIETEAEALEKATQKLGVKTEQLTAKHTDTHFVFEIKPDANDIEVDQSSDSIYTVDKSSDSIYTVDKSIEPDLREAKKEAAAHFNTFPGNIKIVTDNETCFQFKKVR